MLVALVRHGETDANVKRRIQGSTDLPLNATGRAQAHVLAERLATEGDAWSVILTSPLTRAQETAEVIAARLDLPLSPAWLEWREQHFGEGENLCDAELEARWPGWDPPGKEHDDDVTARGLAALDRVHHLFGEHNVIVVSHGTILRYALQHLTGAALPALPNASRSIVERVGDGWRVDRVGSVT